MIGQILFKFGQNEILAHHLMEEVVGSDGLDDLQLWWSRRRIEKMSMMTAVLRFCLIECKLNAQRR